MASSATTLPPSSVRVVTFGRFLLEVGGEPVRFGARVPRRPLELLKVLIALGGEAVSVETLQESLWPDSDGDRAQGAFASALHRLRAIIGEAALVQADSRLSLSTDCRVDALVFDGLLRKASRALDDQDGETARQIFQEVLELYQGPFLAGEFEPPEILAAREKLHALFLHQLNRLGDFLSQTQAHADAIDLYQKGLQAGELAEELYQKLMRCYTKLGQVAEAKAVYRRMERVLRAGAGSEPSQESEQLYKEILSTHRAKPVRESAEKKPYIAEMHNPSLVVLPFANLNGDPDQEYFSDGITEDVITDLSKISRLSVISQNTAFTYKGRALNLREIGEELGVQYVLEGSVRRADNRVRITAQLIDTQSDHHLWSERFDRELEDIFAVQDEITKNIVTALDVKLLDGEQARLWRKSTHNAQAYDLFLQGRNSSLESMSQEANSRAIRLMEQAIELDPDFARAYAGVARQFIIQWRMNWSTDPDASLARVLELSNRAIELDESLAYAYSGRSHYFMLKRDFEQALADGEKAVALNPEGADVAMHLGHLKIYTGEAKLAVEILRRALRLGPGHHAPLFFLGLALIMLGRYEEALTAYEEYSELRPKIGAWEAFYPAAALAGLGREQEANAKGRIVLLDWPRFSVRVWAARQPFKYSEGRQKIADLLRKAGLPE